MGMSTFKYKKVLFVILLGALSSGAFSVFSSMDINLFVKGYGLLLVLQTGFALIYLSFLNWNDR